MDQNDDTIEGFLNGEKLKYDPPRKNIIPQKIRHFQVVKKDAFSVRVDALKYEIDEHGFLHFGDDERCVCSFKEWDYVQMTMP